MAPPSKKINPFGIVQIKRSICMQVLEKTLELCKKNKVKLLYLCDFGSTLFGTNSETSDRDYKGIFLPSKRNLLLGNKQNHLSFTTGDKKQKNSSEDVDIELWGLHNFLSMVERGETGAIDLLFSQSKSDSVHFLDDRFKHVLDNATRLFDATDARAFVGYALHQAMRYGVKGARLNVVRNILEFLNGLDEKYYETPKQYVLANFMDEILEKCEDADFCKRVSIVGPNGQSCDALSVLGSTHFTDTCILEFRKRMNVRYARYGDRTKRAAEDGGVDYKAVSHAIRVISELKEILLTGTLKFPLSECASIKKIKYGEYPWEVLDPLLFDGINEIELLIERVRSGELPAHTKCDRKFVEKCILSFYVE